MSVFEVGSELGGGESVMAEWGSGVKKLMGRLDVDGGRVGV